MNFVVLSSIAIAAATLTPIKERDSTPITTCLEEIVTHHFKKDDLILRSTEQIGTNLPYPSISYYINFNMVCFHFRRINAYVIEISSDQDLTSKLKTLSSMQIWNSRARFVLLTKFDNITDIFKICAQFTIFHVILLNMSNPLEMDIITYFPYHNFTAQFAGRNMRIIGKCINGKLVTTSDLYQKKLPLNWSNTTLKVYYMKNEPYIIKSPNGLTGIETELVKLIGKKMKLILDFKQFEAIEWGYKLSNGSYTNIFKELRNGNCDLAIGGIPAKPENLKDFDMTVNHLGDDVVWIVPKAKYIQPWIKIFLVYMILLIATFTILVIMSFTFYLLKRGTFCDERQWSSLEISYRILLGIPVVRNFKSNTVRLVFMSWCIFCVIYKINFDASFISILATDYYDKQIKTVQDIIDAKLKFGLFHESLSLYKYSNDTKDKYIYEHTTPCFVNNNCLDKVAYDRDCVTALPRIVIQYRMYLKYETSDGPLLHSLKDKIFRNALGMYFRKGHPVFTQFNQHLMYILTSGLDNYWNSNFAHSIRLKGHSYGKKSASAAKHILDFQQLSTNFALLLLGLGASILVFVIEVVLHKCLNRK